MQKIVINVCHGGFGLSDLAWRKYQQAGGIAASKYEIPRDDPTLVWIVEVLGEDADGDYARLKIVEIPDDVKWIVQEYDGREWVAEEHRTWA